MHKKILSLGALCLALLASCSDDSSESTTAVSTDDQVGRAKYVFFFIGDGMASPQVNVTEATLAMSDLERAEAVQTVSQGLAKTIGVESLNMSQFPVIGSATTHAEDRYITGSAASATAMSAGEKTTIGTIAMKGDHSADLKTMAEMARDKGMGVGIVSSVSIDHATPAAFYAHATTRNHYNYIAAQMASSEFDYFAGGYAKGDWEKYRAADRNPDGHTAADIPTVMEEAGFTIAEDRASLQSAVAEGGKVWAYTGYDGSGALVYAIDRPESDVSLAEFTQAGIDLLKDKEEGFFMMIEGGKVDWALHANDAVAAIGDMIAFDEAVGKAIAFYNENPDSTLIVITGDHECGGMSIGAGGTQYENNFALLQHQKVSYEKFDAIMSDMIPADSAELATLLADSADLADLYSDVKDSIEKYFGLGNSELDEALALSEFEEKRLNGAFHYALGVDNGNTDDENYLNYGGYNPVSVTVTHILNEKAGLAFTSYQHTAVPVPVYALGAGATTFNGNYDNTDIAKKIIAAAELDEAAE